MDNVSTGSRRLIPVAVSLAVTVPKRFLQKANWKKGDRVAVIYSEILVIVRHVRKKKSGRLKRGGPYGC